MTLRRSLLLATAFLAAAPVLAVGPALAVQMPDQRIWVGTFRVKSGSPQRIFKVSPDKAEAGGEAVRRVAAVVSSDSGTEDVELSEADAWLHGSAPVSAALFKKGSTIPLKLTLYRVDASPLASFTGSVDANGAVSLSGDVETCSTKAGCGTEDSSESASLDIEVLAAAVFPSGGDFEIALDLAGADLYEVAYGELSLTESDEVTTCSKGGDCTTTGSSVTTTVEVGWEAIGVVWTGDLSLDHAGLIDVKSTSYDGDDRKLDTTRAELGVAWLDGSGGTSVVGLDDDPLTTFGLLGPFDHNSDGKVRKSDPVWRLAVSSDGWSASSAPVSAEVELTGGETLTIPANSYHRGILGGVALSDELQKRLAEGGSTITISSGDLVLVDDAVLNLTSVPVCVAGACFMLMADAEGTGDHVLSVGVYGEAPGDLPDDMEFSLTVTDRWGTDGAGEKFVVAFDDDVSVLFANDLEFAEDPVGLDLAGKVSLLGEADTKGKQKTLAKGKFVGTFTRDGDGDLVLAGADKDDVTSAGGSLVPGGSVGFELDKDLDGNGLLDAPPLCSVSGNGQGTKNWSSTASTKPVLF